MTDVTAEIPKLFNTISEFSVFIEETANARNWTRLETVSWFCEETGAEYEDVALKLSNPLKEKIYHDACKLYAMPRKTTIEIDI